MQSSNIAVPVPTDLFLRLTNFLTDEGSRRDPVEIVHLAIDYWIDNASWKQEDLLPDARVVRQQRPPEGYWWKKLFVPAGSLARMTYKGKAHVAEVVAGGIRYDGKIISPSEFVFVVTHTSRNAWRDIEFKFADSSSWVLADDLRRHVESGGS